MIKDFTTNENKSIAGAEIDLISYDLALRTKSTPSPLDFQ